MKDDMECSQESHPLDGTSMMRRRHRSLTMGSVPERLNDPFSSSFSERNGNVGTSR